MVAADVADGPSGNDRSERRRTRGARADRTAVKRDPTEQGGDAEHCDSETWIRRRYRAPYRPGFPGVSTSVSTSVSSV